MKADLNILIIQEKGRHHDNWNFRECCSFKRAFEKLNHKVEIWGKGWNSFNTLPQFNDYDIILTLENYGDEWLPNLSNITVPMKFLWSIDSHFRGIKPFIDIFNKGKYDFLLQATMDYVDLVPNKKGIWFPNAYDDSLIYSRKWKDKKHFIGFCGSELNRRPILNSIHKWYPNDYQENINTIGQKMVEAVQSYKIHFNLNVANDINFRTFETIGAGTVLLTNKNNQHRDLGFIDGINFIQYPNIRILNNFLSINKVKIKKTLKYYYNHQDLLESIAKKGQELAKKHTYVERAKLLLDIYSKNE